MPGHDMLTCCPEGEMVSISPLSVASTVTEVSTSMLGTSDKLRYGSRLRTVTLNIIMSVSSSSSVTMSLIAHSPSSVQFHWAQQSGASMTSIKPGRDSISNTQLTSPPSSSKLSVALSVMFSKVSLSSPTSTVAVGARPIKRLI